MTSSTENKNTSPMEPTLPAPTFPLANENNAISPVESPMGTYVDVSAYPGMRVGDVVTLHMQGFTPQSGAVPVPGAEFMQAQVILNIEDLASRFFVPKIHLNAICYGRAEAQYTITRAEMETHSDTGHVLVDMRYGDRCEQ